jgi:uncharacterized protein (DUF1499 family)
LALVAIACGQMGLLQGTPPADLGVRDGRLKAPSLTPNSVSSQADLWPGHAQQAFARIAPLALGADPATAMARLRKAVEAMPGAVVVTAQGDYLYARYTTALMRYTDDVEFWFDRTAVVVQVRSASRLGEGDLGANRKRIEALRARLASS